MPELEEINLGSAAGDGTGDILRDVLLALRNNQIAINAELGGGSGSAAICNGLAPDYGSGGATVGSSWVPSSRRGLLTRTTAGNCAISILTEAATNPALVWATPGQHMLVQAQGGTLSLYDGTSPGVTIIRGPGVYGDKAMPQGTILLLNYIGNDTWLALSIGGGAALYRDVTQEGAPLLVYENGVAVAKVNTVELQP